MFGKTVAVHKTGMHFKRQVSFVVVDGLDVHAEMVSDGFAWNAVAYSKSDELASLEQEARDTKRGLWASSVEPVEPWVFRKRK